MTSLASRWRYRRRFRLLPHNYGNIPQPRWYETIRYYWARYGDRPEVTIFPECNRGYQYVCSAGCHRTFPDYYTRNVHEWREHPGCPKYRIENFHEWLRSDQSGYHSCRCRPEDCEQGCLPGGPFRR
jgi:hypothetical protein